MTRGHRFTLAGGTAIATAGLLCGAAAAGVRATGSPAAPLPARPVAGPLNV